MAACPSQYATCGHHANRKAQYRWLVLYCLSYCLQVAYYALISASMATRKARPQLAAQQHILTAFAMAFLLLLALLPAAASTTIVAPRNTINTDNIIHNMLVRLAGSKLWRAVSNTHTASIAELRHSVVIFDEGPCFWLAYSLYNKDDPYLAGDPTQRAGMEIVSCQALLRILHRRMERTVVVSADADAAKRLVRQATEAHNPPVVIIHWGVHHTTRQINGYNVLQWPFNEACTFHYNCWGTLTAEGSKTGLISLANASQVLSIYPNAWNTAVGFARPKLCSGCVNTKRPFDSTYVFVFGEWGEDSAQVSQINPVFKNATLWDRVVAKHVVVFVRCPDELPRAVGVREARWKAWVLRGRVVCLDTLPEHDVPSYETLLVHAEAVLGVGVPLQSPTPLQALHFRTPVILPPGQHYYIADTTQPPHAYIPESAEDALQAMGEIEEQCRVSFVSELGVRVRKVSTCFDNVRLPALDVFDESIGLANLNAALSHVESECARSASTQSARVALID